MGACADILVRHAGSKCVIKKLYAESYLANMFSIGCGTCTRAVPLSPAGAAVSHALQWALQGKAGRLARARALQMSVLRMYWSPVSLAQLSLSQPSLFRVFFLRRTKTKMGQVLVRLTHLEFWLRGQDLNLRPSGYEPDELPDCSTPRLRKRILTQLFLQCKLGGPGCRAT